MALGSCTERLNAITIYMHASQVHVFETTIRVLGGLLSGHVLVHEDPGLVPGYDGLLLREAQDLGDRLMAAFDTPSGLPGGHVHLQKVGLGARKGVRGGLMPFDVCVLACHKVWIWPACTNCSCTQPACR
jgi:hypothetical protein